MEVTERKSEGFFFLLNLKYRQCENRAVTIWILDKRTVMEAIKKLNRFRRSKTNKCRQDSNLGKTAYQFPDITANTHIPANSPNFSYKNRYETALPNSTDVFNASFRWLIDCIFSKHGKISEKKKIKKPFIMEPYVQTKVFFSEFQTCQSIIPSNHILG